jgi:hypothetical protein
VVIIFIAGLVYAGGGRNRGTRRYRPGRPYDYAPVWFTASAPAATSGEHAAIEQGAPQATLPAKTATAAGVTGGASDRW